MNNFKIFLTIVIVLRNQSENCKAFLSDISAIAATLVYDYEIIIIDNGSEDDTIPFLRILTSQNGIPNLQVYALTKQVDLDTAALVGVENALGDFILTIDPFVDDIKFLPEMLNKAVSGYDVVFAKNLMVNSQAFMYRTSYSIFNSIYKLASGINLANEAPQYKLISRSVINFILRHPRPVLAYRHLLITGGFNRVNLDYSAPPRGLNAKSLREGFDRAMRLLFSTTRVPMRLVTSLSLFGATANFFYVIYIISIGIFKANIASGWLSLSLQQSGMFFLISIVLFVLGEYILQMVSLSNEGPPYYIAQEFNSDHMTRHEKLNVEEIKSNSLKSIDLKR